VTAGQNMIEIPKNIRAPLGKMTKFGIIAHDMYVNPTSIMNDNSPNGDSPKFNPAQQNHDLALKLVEILAHDHDIDKLTDKQLYDRIIRFLTIYQKANAVIDQMFESVLTTARSDMRQFYPTSDVEISVLPATVPR